VSSYAMNYYVFGRPAHPWGWAWGCMGSNKISTISAMDGTSNTIMLAEKRAACQGGPSGSNGNLWCHGWWNADWMSTFANTDVYGNNAWLIPQIAPNNTTCIQYRATGFSSAGCQVALCDGHVRNISPSISQNTWMLAIKFDDGQVLGSDW